ncbi:MAG TPA: methyltransferase [Streptosporangiaceae bacterium]|nr:methyltransferase [Streptosporangiaceae bacterium]
MGQPDGGTATINPAGGSATVNDFNPAARAVEAMVTAQVIGVAARLGMADHLASGPKSGADLVRAMGAHPEDGQRFLCACVAAGLLAEEKPGVYALTPAGGSLRSGGEGDSVRNLAITYTGPAFWLPMGRLIETIMTGASAAGSALGMNVWDFYKAHPEEEAFLAAGLSEDTAGGIADVVGNYDFSRFKRIVDVGGSRGDLLCAILAAVPAASGVLFDRPETVRNAAGIIASHGLGERVEIVGGSFFEEIPGDGDLYVLKRVLCDWDDAHALQVLENCRRACGPGAHLLIAGGMLPSPPPAPTPVTAGLSSPLHLLSLVCRAVTGGKERTVADMRNLIAEAGWRTTATMDEVPLVEAEAV